MRIGSFKSEAMFLDWKRVECLLQVREEILPQVEFKDLRALFTSEGREVDRRIIAGSAVMQTVYLFVVVKRELSQKANLSI